MGVKIINNKKLYWWLIGTFAALYFAVAAVSTIHAIAFFQLANSLWLAVLLGVAYEVGQAAVLFSILMTENRGRTLAWMMMLLLTALQITANVYASFKFMDTSGSMDWTYWQRSILFSVQAQDPEMYKVIISWIAGALLPLVALGMTSLVADNIKLMEEDDENNEDVKPPISPGEAEYYRQQAGELARQIDKEIIANMVKENPDMFEEQYDEESDVSALSPEEDFIDKVGLTKEEDNKKLDILRHELLKNTFTKDPNANKPKDEFGRVVVEPEFVVEIPKNLGEGIKRGYPPSRSEKKVIDEVKNQGKVEGEQYTEDAVVDPSAIVDHSIKSDTPKKE